MVMTCGVNATPPADDDHARAEGCLGRRKGEADAPASAPRRTQAARRDRAGKARGTRANVGPRATASAIKASATPILTSWSPRTADAARRIRETGPGREDAAWPPTTATPDDAIATGRTDITASVAPFGDHRQHGPCV